MIGNDVVDIEAARRESNIWRKGWQEKLFTTEERTFILASGNPELAVWLLWSMKEAAYKAWNRQTGIRLFAPQKLQCTVGLFSQKIASGRVTAETDVYHTKSLLSENTIHTIAALNEKMFDNIRYIPDDAILKDSNALPYFENEGVKLPASKSHHGNDFIAIALL